MPDLYKLPFCFLKGGTDIPSFNNSILFISRRNARSAFLSSSSANFRSLSQASFDCCRALRFSSIRQRVVSISISRFSRRFSCFSTIISNASPNSPSADFRFRLAFARTGFFTGVPISDEGATFSLA